MQRYEVWQISTPREGVGIPEANQYVIVLSPDEMNTRIRTAIVAPLTGISHGYPTRVCIRVRDRDLWLALDQITTITGDRFVKKYAKLTIQEVKRVKSIILEMLVQ